MTSDNPKSFFYTKQMIFCATWVAFAKQLQTKQNGDRLVAVL